MASGTLGLTNGLGVTFPPDGNRVSRSKRHHASGPCGRGRDEVIGSAGGGAMADDDMKAELERLRAENERLKNRSMRGVSLKVSEKGGVSVYGLGRFPVTLYKEQWTRLLDMADDIRAFIKENESELKTKG